MQLIEFESDINATLPKIKGKSIKDITVKEWGMSYAYYFEFEDGSMLEVAPEYGDGINLNILSVPAK